MAGDVNIEFNMTGDINVAIRELRMEFEAFRKQVVKATGGMDKNFKDVNRRIEGTTKEIKRASDHTRILALQAGNELYQALEGPFRDGAQAVYDFDGALREVSAITGVTGKGLDDLGGYARESAKAFGGNAAEHLKTYQLLLSELTPELANKPEALKEMGDWVNTLSLTMGGDTVGATRALNAAMNQFGVDLSDPAKAAATMRDMMNQMGAAAQAGSAEVPDIATALNQVGSAAKAAGLNFADTNAALQVLGKAGKKGSEGGVALRNVLRIMARDDFMPKEVADRMKQYGVNLSLLSNPAVDVREKLLELQKISDDGTLLSGLFGENEIAGRALVDNVDLFDEFKQKIVENKTAAEDMAETIAGSLENRKGRITAFFEDIRLSIVGAFGDTLPYVETMVGGIGGMINLAPGIQAISTLMKEFSLATKLQAVWTKILTPLTAGWAVVTKALGVAFRFMMGPVGWIITAIGLISAGVIYAWNNFEGFRAAIYGIWEAVKKVFSNIASFIGDMLQPFFDAVKFVMDGEWGKAAAALGKGLMNMAVGQFKFIGKLFGGDFFEGAGEAYAKGDAEGRAAFREDQKEDKPAEVEAPGLEKLIKDEGKKTEPGSTPKGDGSLLGGVDKPTAPAATSGSSGSGRMVSTRIEQLVGTLNVYVQGNVNDFEQKVRDAVNTALIGAVRDSEIALS